MISLLLAAVLATSVGQLLFCYVIWRYSWYHGIARILITAFILASSFGGIWFMISSLTGLDGTLGQATLYAVPQAIALWLILASRLYEVFSEDTPALQTVATRLGNIETHDEDRFSEKEEEQADVRARLVLAAEKQHEKLDEILRLLRRGR